MASTVPLTAAENTELAEILFPTRADLPTIEQLHARYPKRNLPASAKVVRVAPSPTGSPHIGALMAGLVNRLLAWRSGGVFLLRIEDTDSKREVDGSFEGLARMYTEYGIVPDEGFLYRGAGQVEEAGAYGPYKQSDRKAIYQACAKYLVSQGKAYPCFCTEAEISEMQESQKVQKARPGYYGRFAKWRDAPLATIKERLAAKTPFVIRVRSVGDGDRRIVWEDGVRGKISVPENDLDAVILKADGQSLYHLAHLVDDHFMGITHVLRGEEWVSSVPLHLQLWQFLGWSGPSYSHYSTIQKMETVTEKDEETGTEVTRERKRKLSKRLDPDASVEYYGAHGYPPDAVIEYLLNIANSDFEEWRRKNPDAHASQFDFQISKMSVAGALADLVKLGSIARDVVSRIKIDSIFDRAVSWARSAEPEFAALMEKYPEYTKQSINIEREGKKPSKRIGCWTDIKPLIGWMFDEIFTKIQTFDYPETISREDRKAIAQAFLATWDIKDPRDTWFAKCKEVARTLGFAAEMKEWKADPSKFKGNVADVTMILRVAMSGMRQTPDLCEVMQVLGEKRVRERLALV